MTTFLLFLVALAGAVVAFVAAALNSQTPVQLGPLPVAGGALVALVFGVAVIARLAH